MMRADSVSVYRFKNVYIFVPSVKNSRGLLVDTSPGRTLSGESATGELIAKELRLLASDVAPQEGSGIQDIALEIAGVKSWRTFVKHALLVNVDLDESHFSIVPTINDGRGFEDYRDEEICTPLDSEDSQLGAAILKALEKSR